MLKKYLFALSFVILFVNSIIGQSCNWEASIEIPTEVSIYDVYVSFSSSWGVIEYGEDGYSGPLLNPSFHKKVSIQKSINLRIPDFPTVIICDEPTDTDLKVKTHYEY
jgi:hypothetical protein